MKSNEVPGTRYSTIFNTTSITESKKEIKCKV